MLTADVTVLFNVVTTGFLLLNAGGSWFGIKTAGVVSPSTRHGKSPVSIILFRHKQMSDLIFSAHFYVEEILALQLEGITLLRTVLIKYIFSTTVQLTNSNKGVIKM